MAVHSRILSVNADMGITTYHHYDDQDGRVTIAKEQDVTALVEQNKALFNEGSGFKGDMKHVASIPMPIYMELMQSGKLYDRAYMRRWLNDPDNRLFRTHPGRV